MYFKFNKAISLLLVMVLIITALPMQAIAQTAAYDNINKNIVKEEENKTLKEDTQKEVNIIGEVREKREKNIKHFLKEDGTYEAAIYPTAVHYKEGGQWVDIDNSLSDKKDESGNSFFENKNNDFKISIAKKADAKKLVSIKKDKYEISWNLEGAEKIKKSNAETVQSSVSSLQQMTENQRKKTLTNLTSTVSFKEIMSEVDLQYVIEADHLKENIILNNKINNPVFTFNLETKNLTAEYKKDNTIVFFDAENKADEIFIIDAPIMFDAKGINSNNIAVELKENKKGYSLTLKPDTEWLNSSERVYPVTIDPWLKTIGSSAYIKDSYVNSQYPDNNFNDYSSNRWLHIGSNSAIQRAYISFTQLPQFKTGEMIIGAYFSLYNTQAMFPYTYPNARIAVRKVKNSWNDNTLTWNNQPQYESRTEDYQLISNYSGSGQIQYLWDITNVTKEWYFQGSNYGLMLEQLTYGLCIFASANEGYYVPQMYISYVSNVGLESYWTYHSQNAGRAGTGYINDYTGNLVFVHEDMTSSGIRMPINISHVYNTHENNSNIGYGLGWRLNLSQKIYSKTIENQQYMIYVDGDGTEHYFKYNIYTASYDTDKSGLGLTFTSGYIITDKDKNQLKFSGPSSYLSSITDRNGNTVTLSYEGTILKTITDASGRTANLSYTSSKLSSITDFSGRITSYEYTGDKLTKITYPDGKSSEYTYNSIGSNNMLSSANNHNGYKIVYSYYNINPYRINKVEEYGSGNIIGQELNISYGNNLTSFIDAQGRKNIYTFNNYGNTISVMDNYGNAQYYKYLRGGNLSNKLSLSSKLQASIMNYIKNHDAEANTYWTSEALLGSAGICSYSTQEKYIGNQALKIEKTNAAGSQYYSQQATLIKGKTYTLSGYIKTSSVSCINNKGAALNIIYQDNEGTWKTINSKFINGTNDWQRHEVSFTMPSDAVSDNVYIKIGITEETGIIYIDTIQMEDGEIANRYNLIENADFTQGTDAPEAWLKSSYCHGELISWPAGNGAYPAGLSQNCFKLTGAADQVQRISQTIKINGKRGDVFSAGGWSKGEAVPAETSANRVYGIEVAIKDIFNYTTKTIIPFNAQAREWHYVSDRVIANADYTEITISVVYDNNANEAFFDGLQLYKEEFGSSYQYDSKGNVISASDLASQNSYFQYNSNNDLIGITNPKGSKFNYFYDNNKNLVDTVTAENVTYSFTYDSYGNPLTAKVGSSQIFINTTAVYTLNGNFLKTITDPSGNITTYNYNESKGILDNITDAKNQTTSYEYDIMDRLTNAYKTAEEQEVRNIYEYENDRLKKITHNGFNYIFDYDSLGSNTAIKAANQTLITNTFEARTGKLIETTYGNGQKIGYSYDNQDRITAKSFNGAVKYKYEYDAGSNIGRIQDLVNNTSYRYIYDMAERISRIEEINGNTTAIGYDAANNVKEVKEKLEGTNYTTSYAYDKDNKPKKTTISNGAYSEYTYDTIARITGSTINTGTNQYNTNYSYLNGINGSTTNRLGTITNNGSNISYTYDANDNIETITEAGRTIKYYYNELNKVTREDNQVLNKTITYSYDMGGNLTSKTEYDYTTNAVPANPIKTYSYTYDTSWKDKLISYDGNTITYDEIGNPLNDGTYTYTWEMGRQLAAISGNGNNLSFKYNDMGIRTEKTVNGVSTKYHLVGDKVTYEDNGTDKIYYTYDAKGKLIGMNLNGTEYYYIRNGQGDITGLFDDSGAEVVKYTYDTWGRLIAIEGTLADTVGVKNPYRYRGYRYDSETGLYYMQSRYYNPEWGRFVNADALLGSTGTLLSHNMFAYCRNNPVNRVDPYGYKDVTGTLDGLGGGGGGLVMAITFLFEYIIMNEVAANPYILEKINWNADKNHILKGSKNNHIDGWQKFGIDPNDPNSWENLLPILKIAVEYADDVSQSDPLKDGSTVIRYTKYFKAIGETVLVKIWRSADGMIQRLSDAWTIK